MRIAKRVALGLVALLVCGVVGTAATYWHQGYRIYVIHTGSMIPTYRLGDIVIDKPATHLYRGEVITFEHSATSNVLVTHRIHSIRDGKIRTKGDANPTPDAWAITRSQVRGAVIHSVPRVGYLVVFFKQPTGDAAVMTAALAVILLWSLFFPPTGPTELESVIAEAARGRHRGPTGVAKLRGAHRTARTGGGAIEALRARSAAGAQ